MTTPTTAAGRALIWKMNHEPTHRREIDAAILAIEAEARAAALDEARAAVEGVRKTREYFTSLDLYIGHTVAVDAMLRALSSG